MRRILRTLALAIVALLPLLAAATPSERRDSPAGGAEPDWYRESPAAPGRADAYADLALGGQTAADPADRLAGLSLVAVTEPPVAALLATAVIWLLAINWRFRRERKRRERDRQRRKQRSGKQALPGA